METTIKKQITPQERGALIRTKMEQIKPNFPDLVEGQLRIEAMRQVNVELAEEAAKEEAEAKAKAAAEEKESKKKAK